MIALAIFAVAVVLFVGVGALVQIHQTLERIASLWERPE